MTKPPDENLDLDMLFDEALERFIGVDPQELRANIEKAKQAEPPAARKE